MQDSITDMSAIHESLTVRGTISSETMKPASGAAAIKRKHRFSNRFVTDGAVRPGMLARNPGRLPVDRLQPVMFAALTDGTGTADPKAVRCVRMHVAASDAPNRLRVGLDLARAGTDLGKGRLLAP